MKFLAIVIPFLFLSIGCTKNESAKNEVWVYTSLYKDTIAEIEPKLKQQLPDYKFNFFQAGSEELATKINAEILAGGTKADVVIFSDPFWFSEMSSNGKLHTYKPKGTDQISEDFKNQAGHFATVSVPVMVLAYNSDAVKETEAPKTFKEMADPKWKGKFSTGSPLASGTNFTTVAILHSKYGWDYFKNLRKNETISEGGNSGVLRRIQTKERPIGWVLLENVLRFIEKDTKLKFVVPDDGAVLQSNTLAIIKKDSTREGAEKLADWLFSSEGQTSMIHSYMYSVLPGFETPKGAPKFEELSAKAHKLMLT